MKALHFGAGNIGRGFIGSLLKASGFELVFTDVNEAVINELNEKGEYTVELAAPGQQQEVVGPVSAINSAKDPAALIEAIATADLITTAVGPAVLNIIASSIAEGLKQKKPDHIINIVACENMIGGSSHLKKAVFSHLTADEQEALSHTVGFPNAAVDRIVPMQHHEDILKVSVEPFFEWVIDETGFIGDVPQIDGATFVQDLTPFIERKLFTVNTGHALAAYVGYEKGVQTIKEAVDTQEIRQVVEGALHETGSYLIDTYGFQKEEHDAYIQKIIKRFENAFISDEVTRVARSPLRKLGADDRLIGPAKKIKQPQYLVKGIVAALAYDFTEDEEAVRLQALRKEKCIEGVLEEVCGLSPTDDLYQAIIKEATR
ncbi:MULTISPECIES: mannitol-1-phosphate 5-dehydrogenase [Bacillus]|uniref:mannitol-1-phosphate 5-dehydrogenase n=1 Tax=Bacillus TaxID=1386 RepID=UPI0011A7A125|nr:mannitol-1-phosphate 5-dehydrogenase [Bacillus sp. WP8]